MNSLRSNFGLMLTFAGVIGLALWWINGSRSSDIDQPIQIKSRVKPRNTTPSPVILTDITQKSGIHFRHNAGAFGLKLYPETMGGGVAFIDYDGDGYQDIFFVNGRDWTPAEIAAYRKGTGRLHASIHGFEAPTPPPYQRTTGALYHNNGDGTFSDVTAKSGLDIEMQGMGAAVGDYDGDGRPDLYVTSYGHNYLFHNEGAGSKKLFREVARQAGVQDEGFGTSAAWLDYDRDGKLDLFVGRYIKWSPDQDTWNFGSPERGSHGFKKDYSGPNAYEGESNHLYRNLGNGRFVDVTKQAGIEAKPAKGALTPQQVADLDATNRKNGREGIEDIRTNAEISVDYKRPGKRQGKAMGITLCDINNDGWPDLIVSNDQVPTALLRNNRDGTFIDIAARAGLAYNNSGAVRAGMGVDAGDIDHSGLDSMVVGNFAYEYIGLYQNQSGAFTDIASTSQVAAPSQESVTFGCTFLDINNDGWLDIMAANGHAQTNIHALRKDLEYKQRPLLYINRGQKQPVKFDEVGVNSGAAMQRPIAGRGLAYADIDLDGDLDVVITTIAGPPLILRNDAAPGFARQNSLRLTLEGRAENKDAIGAIIEATVEANGKTDVLRRMVKSGSSYLSQSELPLTLGLGVATQVKKLIMQWPDGYKTEVGAIAANQRVTISEDRGLIEKQPFKGRK